MPREGLLGLMSELLKMVLCLVQGYEVNMKRMRQEYLLIMCVFAGSAHRKIQVVRNLRR